MYSGYSSGVSCQAVGQGVPYQPGQLSGTSSRRAALSIDRIDSCPEYVSGLGAVCCATLFLWILAMPTFDLLTMPWIQTWQANPDAPPAGPISLEAFKSSMMTAYGTPQDAFAALDLDFDSRASLKEFVNGTKKFVPPLTDEQSMYAFKGLDMKHDATLDFHEFQEALGYKEFYHTLVTTMTITVTTMTTTPMPTTTMPTTVPTTQWSPAAIEGSPSESDHTQEDGEDDHVQPVGAEDHSQAVSDRDHSQNASAADHANNHSELHSANRTRLEEDAVQTSSTLTSTTMTGTHSTTEDLSLNVGPVSMKEFIERLGPAVRDSPRDAFDILDLNDDGISELDEFVNATAHLVFPLSTTQSEDVFLHLDTNQDNVVQAIEFFDAFRAEKYLKPEHSTTRPITLPEYHARMPQTVKQLLAVLMQIDSLDYDSITDAGRAAITQAMVKVLAESAHVGITAIQDLQGKDMSLSLSAGGRVVGRRLRPSRLGSVVVKGRIDLAGGVSDDVVRMMSSTAVKESVATALNDLPDLKDQHRTRIEDIEIVARKQNTDAFMWADRDHDGALDLVEFIRATGRIFNPPLTEAQATYAFDGLDSDRDQMLSATEYEGFGVQRFFQTPPKATTHPPRGWQNKITTTRKPVAASGLGFLP